MTRYFGLVTTANCKHAATFRTLANYPISTLKQRSFGFAVFFFVLVLIVAHPLSAQRFRLFDDKADSSEPMRWLRVEKSFGVVPEIDFVNGGMGINICRGKFIRGNHHGMAGTGYYAGYLYDTDHQISVAGFGGWMGFFRWKFGGQLALKGMYYVNRETQVFGIRPEAGIGFPKAQLNYGYNFFTGKNEMPMPTHSVTLYVYFGIHSSRTNLY